MGVLKGVLDGQGMEVEGVAKPVLNRGVIAVVTSLNIDPEETLGVLDGFFEATGGIVGVELAGTVAIDHSKSGGWRWWCIGRRRGDRRIVSA